MLYVVMYHYVRDLKCSRYPEIKGLDYKLFKQQIEFFKNKFEIVTMEEVIEACNSTDRNLLENALLITFDDGYIDHFTMVFPVLKENKNNYAHSCERKISLKRPHSAQQSVQGLRSASVGAKRPSTG